MRPWQQVRDFYIIFHILRSTRVAFAHLAEYMDRKHQLCFSFLKREMNILMLEKTGVLGRGFARGQPLPVMREQTRRAEWWGDQTTKSNI